MATIRPFAAQRFSPDAGPLEDLVAPPYDVISPEQRAALAARSPHNTVLLTLPEGSPDDRSKFVKYARSSSRLSEWRREGVLQLDEPSLYRYTQTFSNPVTGQPLTREALICLLKVEPYENGVVLPHEQTFPKHKEDRLRLLEATRTHLECIYGLYEDEGGRAGAALSQADGDLVADVEFDGVGHRLVRCAADRIVDALKDERVWIADGHHRYETALAFRQALGPRDRPVAEDFMMIALSSMRDPGLIILPTHRILSRFDVPMESIEAGLGGYFDVEHAPNENLADEVRRRFDPSKRVLGIATKDDGYLVSCDADKALEIVESEGSERLRKLDVTILHDVILKHVFRVEGMDRISYTRDASEAVSRVAGGDAAAFIMNPPSVEDMREIALGGEKMPQKSTYYYPKLLSGLVFWSLEDFE